MSQIIDRRLNGKNKSAVNRQKFIKRFKSQIKKAVSDAISGRSISDITGKEKISIPSKDLSEPTFRRGKEGLHENIHPGNREFVVGDRVPKPPGGKGEGNKASNSGEGEDDFVFELSREEFMEFFFEDLELPDMIKQKLASIETHKMRRAGFSTVGVQANMNIVRTFKTAIARRIALQNPRKRTLREAEEKLENLLKHHDETDQVIIDLQLEIERLKKRVAAVPFIDTFDMRFNSFVKQAVPTTQACLFMIMDVSGSMDRDTKDMAKRFFTLLYLFLTCNYKKIDIVFIRHHTIAAEVDEEEFFYSKETGGTVVSSALELMHQIIQERYPVSDWNIYAAQASDGDNWNDDSPLCEKILLELMDSIQYYAYVEITTDQHQNLWTSYLNVGKAFKNFSQQRIESAKDIYPVLRKLFERKETS